MGMATAHRLSHFLCVITACAVLIANGGIVSVSATAGLPLSLDAIDACARSVGLTVTHVARADGTDRRSNRRRLATLAADEERDDDGGVSVDPSFAELPALMTRYRLNASPESPTLRLEPVGLGAFAQTGPSQTVLRYTVAVDANGLVPKEWSTVRQRFEMTVLYPAFQSGPRPVVVLLHPSQVLPLNPLTDLWQTCSYLATFNFICVMSRERVGEFGESSTKPVALGLGRRGLAMLRQVYWLSGLYVGDDGSDDDLDDGGAPAEEDAPYRVAARSTGSIASSSMLPPTGSARSSAPPEENPLAGRVQRRAAAYGYSLGGNAVQDLAALSTEADQIKCIVTAHSTRTSESRASRVRTPILTVTGDRDTLTPGAGPLSLWNLYSDMPVPFALVSVKGLTHVDSVCGNSCPAVVVPCCNGSSQMPKHMRWINAFLHLYLHRRREYAPMFWDESDSTLISVPEVVTVRKHSRISVEKKQSTPIVVNDSAGPQEVPAIIVRNEGMPGVFKLVVDSVENLGGSAWCESMIKDGPLELVGAGDRVLSFEVTPKEVVQQCRVRAFVERMVQEGTNGEELEYLASGTMSQALVIDIFVPEVKICRLSEWSEWSSDCSCCGRRSNNSPWGRAQPHQSSPSSPQSLAFEGDVAMTSSSAVQEWAGTFAGDFQWLSRYFKRVLDWIVDDTPTSRDPRSRAAASNELADLVNAMRAVSEASCGEVIDVVDGNGDGDISITEASAALDMLSQVSSPRAVGIVSRDGASSARAVQAAPPSFVTVGRSTPGGQSSGMAKESTIQLQSGPCSRTRTIEEMYSPEYTTSDCLYSKGGVLQQFMRCRECAPPPPASPPPPSPPAPPSPPPSPPSPPPPPPSPGGPAIPSLST